MFRHFRIKSHKKKEQQIEAVLDVDGIGGQIVKHLVDSEIQKIGVYGMPGVGKTINVKNEMEAIKEAKLKLFDLTLFFTVTGDVNTLRNDIMKEFGASKQEIEQEKAKVANLLYKRLKGKTFLLVLDDVREKISLEELGVPEPTKENGCKLLVISRNRKVLDLMETRVDLMVPPFTKEDAWTYFSTEAGDVVKLPSIEPIAKRIVEECDCIPLAVRATGEAMKGRSDESGWLRMLSDWVQSRPSRRIYDKVFARMKSSYDHLESELLKDCFLSCAFFVNKPEEISVQSVIENWIFECYIDITEEMTLLDGIEKGAGLVVDLKEASLLDLPDGEHIRMNTVIRHLGMIIKSKKFVKQIEKGLLEAPDREIWEEAEKISLKGNRITRLHQNPNCPNLTVLILYNNFELKTVSPEFFEQMPELRVLDLSWTNVESLPQSVGKLVKLRLLDLQFCRSLKNVAFVGALKELLILDLSATPIEELPPDIGELTQLRRLRLALTVHLKRIPSGVISKLFCLESLQMSGSSYVWKREGPSHEANLQELLSLTRLSAVTIVVRGTADYEFFEQTAALQVWRDDINIDCHILETSMCMKFEGKLNKWESEFEDGETTGKIFSVAASVVDRHGHFFDIA